MRLVHIIRDRIRALVILLVLVYLYGQEKGYHSTFAKLQSVITETYVIDKKTKMYFMHGVGTYETNAMRTLA